MTGKMLNLSQTRVIDPVLTNVAQGYMNQEFVGSALFPRVPVMVSGGQILEFGKESFRSYNSKRAPGTATRRLTFGYLGKPFALENDALDVPVPRELMRDASVTPGVDLGTRATNLGMRTIMLNLEIDQANVATATANYTNGTNLVTLDGSTNKKFTDDATDPVKTWIDPAREAIRSNCGRYPNTALFSASAFNAFKNNAKVIDRYKYVQPGVITPDLVASLINVERVVVGSAVKADDAGTFSDVWGNCCILAVTELGTPLMEVPSYGYTYTMEGHPLVEVPYWDPEAKSWVYGVQMERVPVLSGIISGYLINTPS